VEVELMELLALRVLLVPLVPLALRELLVLQDPLALRELQE
jgi:hypothetical protein